MNRFCLLHRDVSFVEDLLGWSTFAWHALTDIERSVLTGN